jgi:hypothetical protein
MRLGFDDFEGLGGGDGDGGGEGGGVDEGAGAVGEPVDELLAAGYEASDAAEGLAKRADADVNGVFDILLFADATAEAAEDAGGVGFIDHEHGVARGC